MKKIFRCVLFLLLILTSTCSAITELQRWMLKLSTAAPEDRHRFFEEVVSQPELAKEILFDQPFVLGDAGKGNAFMCLKVSSYRGLITQEEFFDVGCKMIANLDLYHINEGGKAQGLQAYSTGLANYGFDITKGGDLQKLLKMFDSLLKILSAMEKNGLISNSGTKNSLAVKIEGAKDAIQKQLEKGKTQAINKIEAAKNEATAQKGKHLAESAFIIFWKGCDNLIWQTNHTQF